MDIHKHGLPEEDDQTTSDKDNVEGHVGGEGNEPAIEEATNVDLWIRKTPAFLSADEPEQKVVFSSASSSEEISQSGSGIVYSKLHGRPITLDKPGGALLNSEPPYSANAAEESQVERSMTSQQVREHVLETFGSAAKADHWLNRPNHLFEGKTPLQMLEVDPIVVDDELTRIDHGVYI